MGDQGFLK